MNSIQAGSDDLIYVDYSDLFSKILHCLRGQKVFKISDDNNHLHIDIDSIAAQVANQQVENPLGVSANSAKAATVNFSPGFKENFPNQIQQIRDCLKQILESALGDSTSIEEFVGNLVTDLHNFKGDKASLDFTYPFLGNENLEKQRLSFNSENPDNKELLKVHKLTITVHNTRDFNRQLQQGLKHYIDEKFSSASAGEKEDIEYIIEDLEKETNSDFYKLRDIVNQQTLGKLKKQAQINYLEFLHDNINTGSSADYAEGAIYLQDLIRRLKLIEEYINDTTSVVFFNLFNGIQIPGEQKNYNGVISYATLLNIYNGILDDEDIRKGLIFNGSLKNDILQYLTLFHFSRYQKASKDIHLKLDPYENLIGEESVGKLSLFNHVRGKSEFNSLAFLTQVKKVLNAEGRKG